MKSFDPAQSRLSPLLRLIFAGGILSVALFSVLAWTMVDSRNVAWKRAEQTARNLSLSLERDLGRTLTTLDLSIRAAVQGARLPGLAAMNPDIRHSILFDGAIEAGGIGGVFVTNANGEILYASAGRQDQGSAAAAMPIFQAHRARDDLGLLVSRPTRDAATGAWFISLARRVNAADGTFAGIVAGRFELAYLDGLFRSLDVGPGGNITFLATDGTLISRQPPASTGIGSDLSTATVFQYLAEHSAGTYEAVSTTDGVQRLYGYRQIGSLPLLVAVGLSRQDIFAEWQQKSMILGSVVGLLALVSVVFAAAMLRSLSRWKYADRLARISAREAASALARLDALFINSPDAMFVARIDERGLFFYEAVNPMWQTVTGATTADVAGTQCGAFWPKQAFDTTLTAWTNCIQQNRQISYAMEFEHAGQRTDWEVSVAPVLNHGNDDSRRLIGVARNITERKQLEASLHQAHRMEAVGQLAAGIAHDFNNMLHAIMGNLEMLSDQRGLDPDGRECVHVAEEAGRRCATLVHQLLAFSKKQTLAPTLLSPARVIEESTALFARVLGDDVTVKHDVQSDTWTIRADATQLNSCLLNLVLNARDACRGGAHGLIILTVANVGAEQAALAGLAAQDYVCFEVVDHGCGIPADVLARVMEPFFTTKPAGGGTGLGLSMVQGFARQSGGDIRIESKQGSGTKVGLWLPRVVMPVATSKVVPSASPAPRGRGRVLVVDDEPLVRDTLTRVLEKAGFGSISVEDGEKALEIIKAGEHFDLLVTDQSMPGIKGSHLIQAVGRLRPSLPTILVTGYDRVTGLDELAASVMIMRKPLNRTAFLQQVVELTDLSQMPADMDETAPTRSFRPRSKQAGSGLAVRQREQEPAIAADH